MASGVARNSAVMFAGTLTSRVLGLVRSPLLFGIAVGLNYPAGNAFDVANKLPTLIYMLVAGGVVNAVLVPAIVRAAKRDSDGGLAYINKMVTLGVLVLGAITAVLTLASPLLVSLFASGLEGAWYNLAVAFAFWCVPQVFFYGMYTLLGQILNAKENFGPYMWAPVLNNIIAIAGLLLMLNIYGDATPENALDSSLWDGARIALLGGSATLGIVAQAAVLLIPLYRIGVRLKPDFQFRGAGLTSVAKSGGWVLASMGAGMIPTMLISNVASVASQRAVTMDPVDALGVPGNAAYTTAYSLYSLPTSLVVVSIVTAIFTQMSNKAAAGDMAGVRQDTSRALRVVGIFTFLATALIVVLATPAVRIISPGSSWEEVASISTVLLTMSLGLVGVGAFTVLQRVYYALEDARGLFFVQLPFFVLHAALIMSTVILPARFVVAGVGVSMAITNTVTCIAAAVQIRRRLGGIDGTVLLRAHIKLTVAAIVSAIAGFATHRLFGPFNTEFSFFSAVLRIIVVAVVMVAVYVAIMWMLRMPELKALIGPLKNVWARLRRRPTPQTTTLSTTETPQPDGAIVAMNLEAGRRLRDRYELVEPLEQGDSLATWRGIDTVLGADVRLIVIPSDNPTREATVDAARRGVLVEDVRLIRLLSIFDLGGDSIIVTELPRGTSVASLIEAGPTPEDQVRAIVGETAGAVDAGVRRGVRHLNLRPELISVDNEGAILVDGLGIDAALMGEHPSDYDGPELDGRDARNLSLIAAALVLGEKAPEGQEDQDEYLRRAGEGLEDSPLHDVLLAVAAGTGPRSTSDFIRQIVPWDHVHVDRLPEVDQDPTIAMTPIPDPFEDPQPTKKEQVAPLAAGAATTAQWPKRTSEESAQDDTADVVPPPPANSWEALRGEEEPKKRGINTTAIVLILIALLVVVAGVFAINNLTRGTDPVTIETTDDESLPEDTNAPDGEGGEQSTEPTEEETEEELPEPVIASATLLNPQAAQLDPTTVDSQDNPGSIPNTVDGDPATTWSSWWYSDPAFWQKDGIGIEITLAEETEINEVVLNVDGNGGLVQWRDTVRDAPNSGQVIAEGSMSAETVLTASEPVRTQTIILWFEDLPTANSDGQYRIDISEITVR
ncbi:MAG: murein biosynthesis integral membrane protein MurJ [Flaviflexus sp.]|uniref:murein biosynthesis integral membrane protein MurJ n=1 Tax=Flaviflexus sp. TaxID=1969482 RepID=UPI00352FB044